MGRVKSSVWVKNNKYMRKFIGMFLLFIPDLWGITKDEFYKCMQDTLVNTNGSDGASVRSYTRFGVPQSLSYDELEKTIQKMYDRYINDQTVKYGTRQKAQDKWNAYGERLLSVIKKFYRIAEWSLVCDALAEVKEEELISYLERYILESFKKGIYPSPDSGLTKSEVEFLRRCVNNVHTKTPLSDKQLQILFWAKGFIQGLLELENSKISE